MYLHIQTINQSKRVVNLHDSFRLNEKGKALSKSDLVYKAKEHAKTLEGKNYRSFYLAGI